MVNWFWYMRKLWRGKSRSKSSGRHRYYLE